MRLLLIACCFVLLCCTSAAAQRIQSDSLTTIALQPVVPDSVHLPAPALVISYPVMRHAMYGTAGGAAIATTLFGVLSVLCSSPSCPKLGQAITYGAAFGALTGAAVGAVSGLNTPVSKPTAQRAGNQL